MGNVMVSNPDVTKESVIVSCRVYGLQQAGTGSVITYKNPDGVMRESWGILRDAGDGQWSVEAFKIDWDKTLNAQVRRGCSSGKQMCGHRPLKSCSCDYAQEVINEG